ncbi:uncharacterized protein LOC129586888 [Paramacrobiotus metropolitanus]|uniref:uncharacterized protein LOC129586888 n=1 Tax=Paramacrobiotus metropolitanus TaxID=2943436 RepID=UPI0024460B49|nr:uncharacterized protein LOC129586888 [Paramacrobiotus metropolitanus]
MITTYPIVVITIISLLETTLEIDDMRAWILPVVSRKLAYAQEHSKNGIINLGFSTFLDLPNQSVKTTVIRPEFGSAVSLSCTLHYPERSEENSSYKNPVWVLWDHSVLGNLNTKFSFDCAFPKCYECHCKRAAELGPKSWNFNTVELNSVSKPNRLVSTVYIPEAVQFFAGMYSCTENTPNNVSFLATRILMSPRYQPTDVFSPPMQNVNKPKGQTAQFRCYTKFEFLQGTNKDYSNRFIWYHEKGILYAPKTHPFHILQIDAATLGSNNHVQGILSENGTCSCYSTLVIHNTSPASAGRIECWFQIDPFLDEWLKQSAYLVVQNNY